MRAGLYRHYKGGIYQALGVAQHTETKEKMVVYVALDPTMPGPRLRVRPLLGPDGWATHIDKDEKSVVRFKYIGEEMP